MDKSKNTRQSFENSGKDSAAQRSRAVQNCKIIPYRIVNFTPKEDAKLMVTSRKESRITIKASVKSLVQSCVSPNRTDDCLLSFRNSIEMSRPLTQVSARKAASSILLTKEVKNEQLLAELKSTIGKSAVNLTRLKGLTWDTKTSLLDISPINSHISANPDATLSTSILPKVYAMRPLLIPFLGGGDKGEGEVQATKGQSGDLRVTWSIKETYGDKPNGREGSQLVVIKNQMYIFGGQSRIKHTDLRVLDCNIWTWKIIATVYTPQGRLGHSLLPYKGKLILYGGQSQHSQNLGIRRCSRKVFYLSLNKKKWQHYSGEGEKPEGRRHHAAAQIGRFMVIYGGMNQHGHILCDLYIYDIKIKKWVLPEITIEKDPGPRSHASLTGIFEQAQRENYADNIFDLNMAKSNKIEFLNSGFYLFGGLVAEAQAVNTLFGLYIRDGRLVWTMIKDVSGTPPSPRYNHAACAVKNRLFIFGGRNDDLFRSTGDSCLTDLFCFNVSTLKWENLIVQGQSPDGRWGHCMASVGTKVLLMGGLTTKRFMSADLHCLDTEKEVNIDVPPEETKKDESPGFYSMKDRRKTINPLNPLINLIKFKKL
ncbi:hypothetical protein SteCoe_10567 [Stentor coeruleus]|uniref:Uncharacterized protein n=1 Tax=Stentor coeruleus TaxID=5963 RepID=A0A1R2CF50_9CILI|nr:hypothetical protein SteCoe_10567 [Stentor coeruleus]